MVALVYIYLKRYLMANEDKSQKLVQFEWVSLVEGLVETYVDLFLIFLLYKFMRPQLKLEDGRTVASAVLFAHDHGSASNVLLQTVESRAEERTSDLL